LDRDERFAAEALPLFRALYAAARRTTGNAQDAEDLVQETFLRGYRAFDRFAPGTNVRAWLYAILHNARTDAVRRGRPIRETEELLSDGPAVAPQQTGLDARLDLERALARVPETFREVLILRDVQELRYDEIAEALGIPIGTVMSRLHRGRALLRRALQEPPR
jgi:RNA polymerase sigma-70 factor (ECF subfamily)